MGDRQKSQSGKLDITECFIDGTFESGKKGLHIGEKTKRGKGTKIMAITDASGRPISLGPQEPAHAEVKQWIWRFKKSL
jgi:hypothetical protein